VQVLPTRMGKCALVYSGIIIQTNSEELKVSPKRNDKTEICGFVSLRRKPAHFQSFSGQLHLAYVKVSPERRSIRAGLLFRNGSMDYCRKGNGRSIIFLNLERLATVLLCALGNF